MSDTEKDKRREISQLMREAASIFNGNSLGPDTDPALPKMQAAVDLAMQLEDKAPLLMCQANMAAMNAVCGRPIDALNHIDLAIDVAMEHELPVPVRNFAFVKFVEIAIRLRREQARALTYAQALVQSSIEEEESYQQFIASLYNLSVVCQELSRRTEWALSILSWLADFGRPANHPVVQQARRLYERITRSIPSEERHLRVSEIEANREMYLSEATRGFLPEFAPVPPEDQDGPLPF